MTTPLRVLFVEDSEDDMLLLVRQLRQGGYAPAFERVETADGLRSALHRGGWEVIISDYTMPRFSGLDNWTRMLSDERLHKSLQVTFTYVLVSVPLQLALALALALLLDRGVRGGPDPETLSPETYPKVVDNS